MRRKTASGAGSASRKPFHLSADQIGRQRRQAIVLAFKVVVLDRHVLAFNVAGFIEAFTKRGRNGRGVVGRSVGDKRDHRQRLLLPARRERPRGCTAKKRDELASPYMIEPHASPRFQDRRILPKMADRGLAIPRSGPDQAHDDATAHSRLPCHIARFDRSDSFPVWFRAG
jgi:hypothetical protein